MDPKYVRISGSEGYSIYKILTVFPKKLSEIITKTAK